MQTLPRHTRPAVLMFVVFSVSALLLTVGIINNIQQSKRSQAAQNQDGYQEVAGTVTSGPFKFKLIAPNAKVKQGDSVSVSFQINSGEGSALTANVAEMFVEFDKNLLEAKSMVESNDILALQKNIDNNASMMSVDIAKSGTGSFGVDTTLVTFNFTVKATGDAASTEVRLGANTHVAAGENTVGGEFVPAVISFVELRTPFSGAPINLPGRLEAENFDLGANGVTYYDNTPGNEGGQYRSGVDADIKKDPKGTGYALGYNRVGEWWEYTVNVTQSGSYDFLVATHSTMPNRTVKLKLDGQEIGVVDVPVTAKWDDHAQTALHNIQLSAGTHILRIENGGQDSADIDYVIVKDLSPSCKADYNADGTVGTADFMIFAQNYKTDGISCKIDIISPLVNGAYVCRLDTNDFGLFAQVYKVDNACAFE